MSLSNLKVNGLYIILFIRAHPPPKNDFHWGLYLHRHPDDGGTKYHVKQQGSGWIADHGNTAGVFKSFLLVGLFRIADVPMGLEAQVDQTIRTYDNQLNQPGISCRVWLLWILGFLQKPLSGQIVLKCNDLEALENETKEWGNGHAMGAATNVQPRPIGSSSLCNL